MALILAGIAALFSLAAALFTALIFLRLRRHDLHAPLAEAIRTETGQGRAEAADHARGLRQELGDTIRALQDTLVQRHEHGVERLRQPIAEIGQKLGQDMTRMGGEAIAGRDTLRITIETKLEDSTSRSGQAARDLREELTGHFSRTSDVLTQQMRLFGEHQHQRLDKLAQELSTLTAAQAQAQETLRQSVEGRLDALRQENSAKLDEMRRTVDEQLQTTLEKRLSESFTLVQTQLENVHQGLGEMKNLATGVGDLKRVLTNVKTRGTWGEVQLGMLLEQFLLPDQYLKNAQVKEGSLERVEFAVRFPGRDDEKEVLLPIDAKFPQEDHERLVQAVERADAAAVEEAAAALEARVKNFAKSVSEKYINPPLTTDFAILFLPTESLFAEVLRRPGLFEQLQRDFRVTLAGPTTLSAMLSAFQLGFRSLAIQKRSSEVWQILGAVKNEFAQHGKVVDTLKRQLNMATNTIDKLGTRTRAMSRSLRAVETLPGAQSEALLGLSPDQVAEDGESDIEADAAE